MELKHKFYYIPRSCNLWRNAKPALLSKSIVYKLIAISSKNDLMPFYHYLKLEGNIVAIRVGLTLIINITAIQSMTLPK